MIKAITNSGYCNSFVSNKGFLCVSPRINKVTAATNAMMAETNILGSLIPSYCSRKSTRKKSEIIKIENGTRLIQSSSISSFFCVEGTKLNEKISITTITGTLRK